MNNRFILILSATGGAGHTRAAQALEQAAATFEHPIRVKHYDCLDFTSKAFKKLYSESYLAIVNKAPELWGYLYTKAESKPYEKKGLMRLFDEINYKNYLRMLKEEQPDVLLCTHFLPYLSVSATLRKAGVTAPVAAVTTDFDAHQYWVDPIVQRFYVHTEESAWQLRAKGVPAERIVIKGIPVHQQFRNRNDKSEARKKLGIDQERLTILMVWGGFGVGKAEEMVKEVSAMLEIFPEQQFTLMLVCGRNEKLRQRAESSDYPDNIRIRVFGFVENIHELMSAADVLVSKAGGLTSAEAMAIGLPMVIVDPIPGQETRNAEIIVEQQAGWKALDIANLGYKLKRLIERPELLETAQVATRSLGKPDAAHDILLDVYETFLTR